MIEKIDMFYVREKCVVGVYNFFQDGTALIYNPNLAGNRDKQKNGELGKGWIKVKYNSLIPLEYCNLYGEHPGFMSPNEKNKIKRRLKITSAIWKCSNNKVFTDLDEAIAYEKTLIEEENKWLKKIEEEELYNVKEEV